MPFKSEKQKRFLYSQEPEVAEKFSKDSKKKDKKSARKAAVERRLKNGRNKHS